MKIELESIATVRGGRAEAIDDDWGREEAIIELDATRFESEALAGLSDFSHLTVVYYFHQVKPEKIETNARHPRGNTDWPKIGIFAQRGKNRPNQLAVTNCRILGVDGLQVRVAGLDAIAGTPVLDIKPYMLGFEAQGEVSEPAWAAEIMANYW